MDFGLLLIILFIVAPLLERLLKAGQQPPQGGPPGQGRPGQPLPRQQPHRIPPATDDEELAFRDVPAGHGREEESAAGMLPDDLWEILTGERRSPVETPVPRGEIELPAEPEAPRRPEPAAPRQAEARPPVLSRDPRTLPRRSTPVRERRLPRVEERRLPEVEIRRPGATVRPRSAGPPPSAADELVRSVPVHRAPKVVSLETPIEDSDTRRARFHERLAATAAPKVGPAVAESPYALTSGDDLRRAIVLAEVLGPPKALQ